LSLQAPPSQHFLALATTGVAATQQLPSQPQTSHAQSSVTQQAQPASQQSQHAALALTALTAEDWQQAALVTLTVLGAAVAQQPATPQPSQVHLQSAQLQEPVSQQKQPASQQAQQPGVTAALAAHLLAQELELNT
jgi:hypothetical protein